MWERLDASKGLAGLRQVGEGLHWSVSRRDSYATYQGGRLRRVSRGSPYEGRRVCMSGKDDIPWRVGLRRGFAALCCGCDLFRAIAQPMIPSTGGMATVRPAHRRYFPFNIQWMCIGRLECITKQADRQPYLEQVCCQIAPLLAGPRPTHAGQESPPWPLLR